MDAHLTPKHAVTILLPTKREAANLRWLCGALHEELDPHVRELEILVVDTPTGDGSEELCAELGARYVGDPTLGFADALRRGFQEATHDIIVTMDADGSHHPLYIRWMLYEIDDVDLVICSRYVGRGGQEATAFRYVTSLILNQWVGTVCSMPIRDLSGGFKMYRRSVLETINLDSTGFEIQCEIAINTYGNGFRLREIPFCYHPRLEGRSKAAVVKYGLAFLFGSMRLRRYRNSRVFCDYDERAYKSRIPMQQWWQRTRYRKMIERMIPEGVTIDVGCGSGRIMLGWPKVIGIDVNKSVLRYLRQDERRAIEADGSKLPVLSESVDRLYCAEVVEHLQDPGPMLDELVRVMKPGAQLMITTPNYGSIIWPSLEWLYELLLPPATGHKHHTRYKAATLVEALSSRGLTLLHKTTMLNAILIMHFEKPGRSDSSDG